MNTQGPMSFVCNEVIPMIRIRAIVCEMGFSLCEPLWVVTSLLLQPCGLGK